MRKHKFSVGQAVRFTNGSLMRSSAREGYRITRLLPIEGPDLEYRIKASDEPYERVARESQLDRTSMTAND